MYMFEYQNTKIHNAAYLLNHFKLLESRVTVIRIVFYIT